MEFPAPAFSLVQPHLFQAFRGVKQQIEVCLPSILLWFHLCLLPCFHVSQSSCKDAVRLDQDTTHPVLPPHPIILSVSVKVLSSNSSQILRAWGKGLQHRNVGPIQNHNRSKGKADVVGSASHLDLSGVDSGTNWGVILKLQPCFACHFWVVFFRIFSFNFPKFHELGNKNEDSVRMQSTFLPMVRST